MVDVQLSPPSAAALVQPPATRPAPPPRKVLPLSEHLINLTQHVTATYEAAPVAGTSLEEVMDPNYWVNKARWIKVGDDILIKPKDNSWRALLQVVSRSDNWVKTLLVYYRDFSQEMRLLPPAQPTVIPDTETAEGFKLSYNEVDLHGVVGPNGVQIIKNIETRKQASQKMKDLIVKFRAGEPLI